MINWPRVRQLRDEVGEDDFDEVVQIFMEEVQNVMTLIQQDITRVQIEQNLHFLKGSALSLGFDQFSKLCQDGERNAAAGDRAEIDLAEIFTLFDQSRQVFETGLAENLY